MTARESTAAPREPAQSISKLRIPLTCLVIIPVAPALKYFIHASAPWIFLTGAIAIAVLADWMRRATEQVTTQVGPAIGGLLNVSFGSIAELILALFVLASGNGAVVRAQITGSIIGTSLLGLGLAIVIGSVGRTRQVFNQKRAGLLATLLILTVIALLLPAVFDLTGRNATPEAQLSINDEHLSLGVSAVLLCLYCANLVYTLVTHRDMFASDEDRDVERGWPLWASLGVLGVATGVVAGEAHLVSGALDETSNALGMSHLFIGVIVLALVGTASDLIAAAWFARRGKMGLVLNICVGSAIQVALVVAPLLVLFSWLMGAPLTLVFHNPLNLFAIVTTAFIVNAISTDGEVTWFEGVLLIGVYLLLGLAFYFTTQSA